MSLVAEIRLCKPRTTNIIECFFVEVRRNTRPKVCFANIFAANQVNRTAVHMYRNTILISQSNLLCTPGLQTIIGGQLNF